MLLCGKLLPLGATVIGDIWTLGLPSTYVGGGVRPACAPQVLLAGLVGPLHEPPLAWWACIGISVWINVTFSSPPDWPTKYGDKPGPWPWFVGALPCRFG